MFPPRSRLLPRPLLLLLLLLRRDGFCGRVRRTFGDKKGTPLVAPLPKPHDPPQEPNPLLLFAAVGVQHMFVGVPALLLEVLAVLAPLLEATRRRLLAELAAYDDVNVANEAGVRAEAGARAGVRTGVDAALLPHPLLPLFDVRGVNRTAAVVAAAAAAVAAAAAAAVDDDELVCGCDNGFVVEVLCTVTPEAAAGRLAVGGTA